MTARTLRAIADCERLCRWIKLLEEVFNEKPELTVEVEIGGVRLDSKGGVVREVIAREEVVCERWRHG